jgi:hypothetical protein
MNQAGDLAKAFLKKFYRSCFIIAVYGLFISQTTEAQTKRTVPVYSPPPVTCWFGATAGVNFNSLKYHDGATTIGGSGTGFHAGFFYRKKINDNLLFQPELLFSMRGGRIKDVDSNIVAVLSYVEIPIQVLYNEKKFFAGGGPYFSFGVVGRFKSGGAARDAYSPTESFERTLKRFEYGLSLLTGYQLNKKIFAVLHYSPALRNIYQGDGSAPKSVKATTTVIAIGLGLIF